MAENSAIQWCDHTFNPWTGCHKVSPGCKYCYAEDWALRWGKTVWGTQGTRIRTSPSNWKKPVKWNREAEAQGVRHKVFCASLADVFEMKSDQQEEMDHWRTDLFELIDNTPFLDWLLLTKRIDKVDTLYHGKHLPAIFDFQSEDWEDFPKNIWMGTSIENQDVVGKRLPHLVKIPAKVKFLSVEPLLAPVDLREFIWSNQNGLIDGHDWLTGEAWQHSSIFGGGNSYLTHEDKEDFGGS